MLLGITLGLLLALGVYQTLISLDIKQVVRAEQQRRREGEALARAQTEDAHNAEQDAAVVCSLLLGSTAYRSGVAWAMGQRNEPLRNSL